MELGTFLSDSSQGHWAQQAAALIHTQLCDEANPCTLDMAFCGLDIIAHLRKAADPSCPTSEARRILEDLEKISEETIKSSFSSRKHVPLHSRRLYADCRLLHSLVDLRDPDIKYADETTWNTSINRLDMAIITAGAPGKGRLDLILDTIALIQTEHLAIERAYQKPSTDLSTKQIIMNSKITLDGSLAPNAIPRISPPSLSAFRDISSASPFILSNFARDWPALTNHPWRSPIYLRQVAGRGRIVPVEIGSDYRAKEWRQEMISWEKFLSIIGAELDSGPSKETNPEGGTDVVYLAQHNLLTQFPGLRSDIIIPDYVYASLPAPHSFPKYHPPGNDEQLVINAWLGPKGTLSPAHTDPYFNCYTQVVGRKTVWLAPPQFQDEIYPFLNPDAPYTTREISSSVETTGNSESSAQIAEPSLANTSRVDVFAPSSSHPEAAQFPLFEALVRPRALCAVLEPGDLLYIPPGWWHAMRSEDISFSVSMWF